MHQALYRKYRPRSFDDVCGQEHITRVLKYETAHAQISHAYLFCGSRGTGKTTSAKILARAVNCDHPRDGSPCGECAACRLMDSGAETDILEMDAASNNKVDDIRAILDEVIYTPSSLRYRVYIVDEVHMLSQSAFNALLKTLEEPPSHVIFILATTELQKLPATIVSRCQRFDFRRIPVPVITERLEYIASREGIALEHDAALMLARLAQGGMRDAISLLELCSGGRDKITPAVVNDAVGSSGRETVSQTVRAIASRNCEALFNIIAETDSSAKDITVFWSELIAYYRDMLVLRTGADAVKYLDLTETEAEALRSDAGLFPRETLMYHSRMLDEAYLSMQRAGAIRRSVAELTLLRMTDERLDTRPEALLSRVAAVESALATGALTVSVRTPVDEKAGESALSPHDATGMTATAVKEAAENSATPAPQAKKETPAAAARKPIRSFPEIAERVAEADKGLGGFVRKCRAYTDGEDGMVVYCETKFTKDLLSRDKNTALSATAAAAVLGKSVSPAKLKIEILAADREPDDAERLDSELRSLADMN